MSLLSVSQLTIMKITFLLLTGLTLFSIASCTRDEKIPEEIPAAILAYIADNKDCICDPYIDLFQWKGDFIYVLQYGGPACSWVPGYFNSKGEIVTINDSLSDFKKDARFIERVWTCQP